VLGGRGCYTATVRARRYHFSGIAGAGTSVLARLVRHRGHEVQGSDRSFDQGKNGELAAGLAAVGIAIKPQDGSALSLAIDRFVYSTSVESGTAEMQAAHGLGIEVMSRPALLAEVVNQGRPGVAIAGTSGKSTITGMVAWIVQQAGASVTVLGGGALVGDGPGGCFLPGVPDGPVVAEACESDGTLPLYRPALGVIHNISRDHGETAAVRPQFELFAANCRTLLVNAGCPETARLGRQTGARTYGVDPDADWPLRITRSGPERARGVLRLPAGDIGLELPQPGRHNLENAAAAALVALELGISPERIVAALARFPGVARRFELVGVTAAGIRVIDDYAHNGEKIRAAITTAQAGCQRLVAVFQPHGFAPARSLRPELKELLPRLLRPRDRFCYVEIFYAGGTVVKDISSRLLASDAAPELRYGYAADHRAALSWVVTETCPGDTVLIMGARDPDLPQLARRVFEALDS
jgi:UDP-N-acetylmuramate--alanine ligase